LGNAGEGHEVEQVSLVGAARAVIVEVGEPPSLGRHVRDLMELRRAQARTVVLDLGRGFD
jgi:hypothetical protein